MIRLVLCFLLPYFFEEKCFWCFVDLGFVHWWLAHPKCETALGHTGMPMWWLVRQVVVVVVVEGGVVVVVAVAAAAVVVVAALSVDVLALLLQ